MDRDQFSFLWSICLDSFFVHFKKGPEHLTRVTDLVKIDSFLIWELIFIYLLRTFPPHLGSFLCCFFFQVILPRPRIGMLSLVTVSPVITAFHSCCLSYHVFFFFLWPSIPLADLDKIWNRYLLTMLTWNRRDSPPLSAAPRAPKGDQGWINK